MARWTPQKKDVIAGLADEIMHNYGRGRVIVAVDGRRGAGSHRFADDLAAELERRPHAVFRASMADFHRPRALRHARGSDSAEGYYLDSFDYATLRRVLIEPFRIGRIGSFVPAAFDLGRDLAIEPKWMSGPDDAILVIDGVFLNRPELRGLWNYSVWVSSDSASATGRQLGGEALYLAEAKPAETANAIVDNSDADHPRRVFADSC
jgi:uridine kinase